MSSQDSNNYDNINIKQDYVDAGIDFSLDDIDWDEPFDLTENSSSTENVLPNNNDISQNTTYTSISRADYSTEFRRDYCFSKEMLEILKSKFGLDNFRPGQREIISAVLNGHDCFVLMPTGGGKSLCYQLPALLSKGVTVVISPLIALIGDQVDKLNSLDIRAAHLCSTLSREESVEIISKLYLTEPEFDLLYLTPEKILVSEETRAMLESLYRRGKLTRFVLDEVHCLSLWGHDFRPHYKELSILREKYPNIQIVCFTATATKQVETDVIVNLKLRNVKRFIQSFNRPNIKYQVVDKCETIPVHEIVSLIRQKFFRKSGIIYCLTRKDCAILSQYLRSTGITAKPYHAGLENELRQKTQREWMQDKFYVIVATIAFGMGIDKPDVRFVIHITIPKSLEAFYQESGRAGRDGEISYSYLFYNYRDVLRTMKLMRDNFTKKEALEGHFDNLEQMIAFANNQIDCRRYLQLLNLGEHFDRQLCMQNRATVCDNCENFNGNMRNETDVTKQAKELSVLVQDVSRKNKITLNMVTKAYQGCKEKSTQVKGFDKHKYFGSGRLMSRLDINRILRELITKSILVNDYITTGGFPLVYVKAGPKLDTFLNSSEVKLTIFTGSRRSIHPERIPNDSIFSIAVNVALMEPVETIRCFVRQIKRRCQESILNLCRQLAVEKNVSVTSVLHPVAVKRISDLLPRTREELLKIQHFTVATLDRLGGPILKLTSHFREQVFQADTSLCERSASFSDDPIARKRTFSEAFASSDKNNNSKSLKKGE